MSIKYCINPDCNYRNTAQDDQQNDGKCVACDNPLPLSVYSGNDASDGRFEDDVCLECDGTGQIPSDIDSDKFRNCPYCLGKGFNVKISTTTNKKNKEN